MREKLKKIHGHFEGLVKGFNMAFFVVSVVVWIALTIANILTEPFEFGLLWKAFNTMYGELSFKVGCIFLIIFNGLATVRSLTSGYHDFKEEFEHVGNLKEFLRKRQK